MTQNKEQSVWFVNTCGSRNVGGGETARAQWSKAFIEKGYSIVWWCPEAAETKRPDQVNEIPNGVSVKLYEGDYLPLKKAPGYLKGSQKFFKEFFEKKPAKVIFNGYSHMLMPLVGGLVGLGQSDKVVQVFHGDPQPPFLFKQYENQPFHPTMLKFRLFDLFSKISLMHPQIRHIAVSKFIKSRIEGLGIAKDISVCFPPTYTHDFCQVEPKKYPENRPLEVITVSRVAPDKGFSFYEKVVHAVKEQALAINFSIVGAVTSESYLETLKKLSGSVEFKGPRFKEALCKEYKQADLLFFPSQREGFGLVTVESLAHLTPVLGRDLLPTQEIFDAIFANPGKLVDAENDEKGVRESLLFLHALVNNPDLLPILSHSAIEAKRRFEPQKLSSQFVDLVLSK